MKHPASITHIVTDIYLATLWFSVIIAIFCYKKLDKNFRLFVYFLLLTCLVEFIGGRIKGNNLWLFNCFFVVEFTFYLFLYYQHLIGRIRKLILVFIVSLIIFSVSNIVFFQGLKIFDTYNILMGGTYLTITVVLYLSQLLRSPNPQPLFKIPMFWVSIGVLCYYTCNTFYMFPINYLISFSMTLAKQLFIIVLILNIIMYSLFAVGFLCKRSATR